MYFLVEPIRNTFSNVRPCSATLQRALQWASDVGAVPERSLSDPERSRSARATLVARPPTVTTSRESSARVCESSVRERVKICFNI